MHIISLVCTIFRASDKVAVEWRKNDMVLHALDIATETEKRIQIGVGYTLELNLLQLNDTGMYSCYVAFILANQYLVTGI